MIHTLSIYPLKLQGSMVFGVSKELDNHVPREL